MFTTGQCHYTFVGFLPPMWCTDLTIFNYIDPVPRVTMQASTTTPDLIHVPLCFVWVHYIDPVSLGAQASRLSETAWDLEMVVLVVNRPYFPSD